jgi:hypothetical protein
MHWNFINTIKRNWLDFSAGSLYSGELLCRLFTAETEERERERERDRQTDRETKIMEVMVIRGTRHVSILHDHGEGEGGLFKDHVEKTKLTR